MNAATAVAVSVAAATASAAAAPSGIQLPADLPDVIEPQEVAINQPTFNAWATLSFFIDKPFFLAETTVLLFLYNISYNAAN